MTTQEPINHPLDVGGGVHSPRRAELISHARQTFDPCLVDAYSAEFLATDELVDELIADMMARQAGAGWRELHRVLTGEIPVAGASAPVRAVLARGEGTDWLDCDRLERGAVAYWRSGILTFVLSMLHVSVEQDTYADLSRPLVLNGRYLNDAGRRNAESMAWITTVTDPGGMRPGSPAVRETLRISILHGAMRCQMGLSDKWDHATLGPPFARAGMAQTVLAFALEPIRAARECGVTVTDEEWGDVLHLWRWIAHLMGVPLTLVPATPAAANESYELVRVLLLDASEDAEPLIAAKVRGAMRLDLGLPDLLATRVGPWLRPRVSTAVLSAGSRWHHPRMANITGVPRGHWRHLPALSRPVIATLDRARRTGLRGSDAAIARRNHTRVTRLLHVDRAMAIEDLHARQAH